MTAPVREEGIIARRIADETILVPATRRAREMALFTLNEVGTFVWEHIDGARDTAALADAVAASFDVDVDRARSDVERFLGELLAAGCLAGSEVPEPGGPA
ncbi:MAG: PqqD family protein [Myxococcota bacterium]